MVEYDWQNHLRDHLHGQHIGAVNVIGIDRASGTAHANCTLLNTRTAALLARNAAVYVQLSGRVATNSANRGCRDLGLGAPRRPASH